MAMLLNFLSSTFYVLHHLVQVFHETVAVLILLDVAGPEVENAVVGVAAVHEVGEPRVVFVVLVSVDDVAGPQASVDIAVAFVVLVPVSVLVVEVDSPERPNFLFFPNVDHFASFSSSVEVGG
jgi:hypothetical protein